MAEEIAQKSGWLRNIASIFVEVEPAEASVSQPAVQASSTPVAMPSTVIAQPASTDFVGELRARFKKIMDDKNQPGFDFYEFSMMLLRSSSNPSEEQFKTAFEGAKMLNPSCNKAFLLSSAGFYKNELQAAYENTIQAGEQKKGTIGSEKQAEQKQLSTDLSNIDQQLNRLRKEIQNLEQQKNEKDAALRSIDMKYNGKLAEIEGKIIATATAKDGVLNDILLIESGINQYLSS